MSPQNGQGNAGHGRDIERNALGAIKAVSAASLALRGDGRHFMPRDNRVRVTFDTGRDISSKYKETSTGGIAVNRPER